MIAFSKQSLANDSVLGGILPSGKISRSIAIFYLLVITPLLLLWTYHATTDNVLQSITSDNAHTVRHTMERLQREVDKFASLPPIIASDASIVAFTRQRDNIQNGQINTKLQDFAEALEADAIYILDHSGTTIASSLPELLKHNYGFRPYFKSAIAGKPERYLAIGVTTQKVGYYFSSPISDGDNVIGVLVLKMGFQQLESEWAHEESHILVQDKNGVVFSTNRPTWRYRALSEQPIVDVDGDNQRYAGLEIRRLEFSVREALSENHQTIHLHESRNELTTLSSEGVNIHSHVSQFSSSMDFLATHKEMPNTGWRVMVMTPIHHTSDMVALYTSLAALLLAIAYIAFVSIDQRRVYLKQRHEMKSRAVAALRISEAQARSIIENTHAALFTADKAGNIETLNPSAVEIFGYTKEEAINMSLRQLFDGESLQTVEAIFAEVMETRGHRETSYRDDILGRRRDGSAFPMDMAVNHIEILNEPKLLVTLHDRTEHRRVQERLQVAAEVVEHAMEGIIVTDPQGTVLSINPAFTAITGYGREEMIGSNPKALKSGRHGEKFYQEMWACLREKGSWQGEIWNKRKSGEVYPEQLSITALRDEKERITGYVGIFSDITQRKKMEERLWQMAHEDALTGLANRTLLMDRLQQSMAQARRSEQFAAVIFIDLDGFKAINDTIGHDVGDRLLQMAAIRLRSCLREGDTAARLGGDEFILVLNDVASEEAAGIIAARVRDLLAVPFEIDEHSCSVSGSIGISLFPTHGESGELLIQHADAAMYVAKKQGKNNFQFYNSCFEEQDPD